MPVSWVVGLGRASRSLAVLTSLETVNGHTDQKSPTLTPVTT